MNKEEKTAAQLVAERIKSMPLHKEYVPVPNIPIPMFKDLLIKKTKKAEIKTKAGILLNTTSTDSKVIDPLEGIIIACGPNCGEYTRVGLKYKLSGDTQTYYMHDGEEYMMAEESMLRFVVPSDDFVAIGRAKTPTELRREKKLKEQTEREARLNARDANDKDKRLDPTKGKIRAV